MKRTCRNGHELSGWQHTCYECMQREDKIGFLITLGAIAFIFLSILAVRIGWALYAFDDWRCTLSECRILKD